MWHWDQGHLAYFQFDALRELATFVQANDFKEATRPELLEQTGLNFAAPETHSPWRNYSRTLKLSLLVSEQHGKAISTPVAWILSKPGTVTCDEYFHFLLQAFTEPSPALKDWKPNAKFRYPLLFSLKYLLTRTAIGQTSFATINEVIGAYHSSNFTGNEDQEEFLSLNIATADYESIGRSVDSSLHRQASESIKVIAQISYLYLRDHQIIVSLNPEDAMNIFNALRPIGGVRSADRESEIRRLADLFKEGSSTDDFYDYPNTTIDDVVESGFREGSKVKRTHVVIERNAGLRKEFFLTRPTAICDFCSMDTTKTYPWTNRVLDIHHLLPLSSGTRVESSGTTLDDLIPVCPSCHRAIHRYYDKWLIDHSAKDFRSSNEARNVYQGMKDQFPGLICA